MTPSLEGLSTKAEEAPSPLEVRLAPLDTNPVFQSLVSLGVAVLPFPRFPMGRLFCTHAVPLLKIMDHKIMDHKAFIKPVEAPQRSVKIKIVRDWDVKG